MARLRMPGITRDDQRRIAKEQQDDLRRAQQSGFKLPNASPVAAADALTAQDGKPVPTSEEQAARALDSFQNFGAQLGLGTNNISSGSSYGFNPITRVRTLLEWIYRGTWIGGVAIDTIAEDMTRAGVDLQSKLKPDQAEVMQTALTTLDVWGGLCETIKWARLYGGCIGVIMIDGQDPSTPLRVETVPEGGFVGILPLDRWMVEPTLMRSGLVDVMGPDYGLPKFYDVRNDAPALPAMKVHHSRCIRLVGIKMPYWQRVMENLWGISVYERLYDRMVAFDSATQGASQLVYKSYIRWQKIAKLREIVAAGGKKMQGLIAQVDLARKYQGIEGMTIMDAEDETGTFQFSGFAGISDALLQFAQQISGALQIPLVRLLGQSPAGLNSTGESDLVTYYDGIKQLQERDLRRGMDKVLRCVAASRGIKLPDNFEFKFAPLWQLSHENRAEVAERITGTVLAAEERAIISPRKAATELREQSRITGVFTNISDKDLDALPDEIQQAPSLAELEAAAGGGAAPGAEGGEGGTGEKPGGTPPAKPAQLMKGAKGKDGRSLDALPRGEVSGIPIILETPEGMARFIGTSAIECGYGYVPGVPSAEGQHEFMDALVGPNAESEHAWIVDKFKLDGSFDEHKLMLGFDNQPEAVIAYQSVYPNDGPAKITPAPLQALKRWLAEGDVMRPYAEQARPRLAS